MLKYVVAHIGTKNKVLELAHSRNWALLKLYLLSIWERKEKKNQHCLLCRREFEPTGPTLSKSHLDTKWGLLPTLRYVDLD